MNHHSNTLQIDKTGLATDLEQRKTQIYNHGLEIKVRGGRGDNSLDRFIRHSSMFGDTGVDDITTTLRTCGLSQLTPAEFCSYPSVGAHWRVFSSSVNDTAAGTGCQELYIDGLDENWDAQFEVIELDGQTGVETTIDWWRVNAMFVNRVGSGHCNEGTIFLTDLGDTIAAGVPQNIIYGNMKPESGYDSIFHFSIPRNHRMEYTIGNFYTDGSQTKPVLLRDYYLDHNYAPNYATSFLDEWTNGSITYDYRGAVGWTYGKVDLEGRVKTAIGTASGLFAYEYILYKI